MNKLWHVALHEYKLHVFSRRFLLGLLSVPLIIAAMIGLIFLVMSMGMSSKPIGYVDHSGLLANPIPPPPVTKPDRPIEMRAFNDESAARTALEAGQIQAYYVLSQDYRTSGNLTVVHIQTLKSTSTTQFYEFLSTNLLSGTNPEIAQRLVKGSQMTVQSADGSRKVSGDNLFTFLMPIIAGIGFIIAMFTAGGYLLQAVVDEKENRTMEVILTSVSANQFMSGKIIGDIAIGLTQILAWLVFIAIIILLSRNSITVLKGVQLSRQTTFLMLIILLPAFVMVAALMAAIGATVTEAREGQQVVGLISLPIWIPYMLTGLIFSNPNSPIVVGLSLFPFTAPLTMLMRDSLTILPAWQVACSAAILILSAIGSVWLAGRAFRLGMLRYGKRLSWRDLFSRHGAVS